MTPGIKNKKLSIIFSSDKRLTDLQLSQLKLRLSAVNFDGERGLLVNQKKEALVPIALTEEVITNIDIGESGKYPCFIIIFYCSLISE